MKEIYVVSVRLCQRVLVHRQKRQPLQVPSKSRNPLIDSSYDFGQNNRKMKTARMEWSGLKFPEDLILYVVQDERRTKS